MPRIAAGSDFLDSLEMLFQEASNKGFTGSHEFTLLKKAILKLLAAVSTMTAARARASCPIELPDGSQPDTYIQLPPSSLPVGETTRETLTNATDGAHFVQILKETFTDQQDLIRSQRGCKRKGNPIQVSELNSPITPKKVRIKITRKSPTKEPSTPQPLDKLVRPIQHFPSPPDSAGAKMPSHIIQSAASLTPAKQKLKMIMSPSLYNARLVEEIPQKKVLPVRQVLRVEEVPPLLLAALSSIGDDDSYISDIDSDEMDIDDVDMSTPKTARRGKQATKSALVVDKIIKPKDDHTMQKEILNDLVTQLNDLSPEQLVSYRPKLMNHISHLQEIQSRTPIPIPDNLAAKQSRRERLENSITKLSSEIARIPVANWLDYQKKLFRFSASDQVASLRFGQRVYKAMDIIWLPEEVQAVPSDDWERMDAVATICSVVAQVVGPENEDSKALSEKWLDCKKTDLRFLKKLLHSVKSARAIFPISEEKQV